MAGLPTKPIAALVPSVWGRSATRVGVGEVDSILNEHEQGIFYRSAQLVQLMLRDERIAACTETRVNALLGCDAELEPCEEGDKRRSKAVCEKAKAWWWNVCSEDVLAALHTWALLLGVAVGEVVWKRTSRRWVPVEIRVIDPQFLYWDEQEQSYFVSTEGGVERVTHGDGRWLVYAPYGHRSWMHGAVRALARLWLMRQWGWRDWARHSERLGQGILVGKVPTTLDAAVESRFKADLRVVGAEGVIIARQGADAGKSFDLSLLEPKNGAHATFDGLITANNVAIAIRLLGQNLTTETQGGSYAAANVQDRVRHDYLEWDAFSMALCLRTGVAEPWAYVNEGSRELAPVMRVETDPPEDLAKAATTLSTVASAIATLKTAGTPVDERMLLEQYDIPLLTEQQVAAVAAEKAEAAPNVEATVPGNDDGTMPPGEVLVGPPVGTPGGREGELAASALAGVVKDPRGPLHRGQAFVDGVVKAASKESPLATLLTMVREAVNGGASAEDIKERLLALASSDIPDELQDLVEHVMVLSAANGAHSCSREVGG